MSMAPQANVADAPRATTFLDMPRLSKHLGVEFFLASETFQRTGSFKFRAAYNVAAKIHQHHVIAASSGNFGQAIAYACRLFGKRCTVVMPVNSVPVKIEAVRAYGGEVDLVDTSRMTRTARVGQLSAEFPDAYIASAYDDPLVIEGNATLGTEIAALENPPDVVVAPVGGGGLTAGLVTACRKSVRQIKVTGAEPATANDAARSLRERRIVSQDVESQTIADGARVLSLGRHNWEILRENLDGIVEVPEEAIREGVRLLFNLAHVKAEPTGALAVAALIVASDRFRALRVCCVVSGANVDTGAFAAILAD
jgi:threonine dehydratase